MLLAIDHDKKMNIIQSKNLLYLALEFFNNGHPSFLIIVNLNLGAINNMLENFEESLKYIKFSLNLTKSGLNFL